MADAGKAPLPNPNDWPDAGQLDVWGDRWPTQHPLTPWDLPSFPGGSQWDFGSPEPGPAAPASPPPTTPEEPLPEVVVSAPAPPEPSAPAPPPAAPWATPSIAELPFVTVVGARPAPRRAPKRRAPVRRSKPKPRPSRRVRPLPRTAPRLPISVPPFLRSLLPVAIVAAITPAYLKALAKLSNYGTEQTFERMYGVPYDARDNQRSSDASPSVGRDRSPADAARAAPQLEQLPEVLVTGTRPSAVAAPKPVLRPVAIPNVGPAPFEVPDLEGSPEPRRVSEPAPSPRPRPQPSPELVPSPATNPRGNPAPEFLPAPGPSAGPRPGFGPSPIKPPKTWELPDPAPKPTTNPDPCDCGKGKGKDKKKKKKRKKRKECWRGTFTETATGLIKRRREKISCKTGKPNKPPPAANEEF